MVKPEVSSTVAMAAASWRGSSAMTRADPADAAALDDAAGEALEEATGPPLPSLVSRTKTFW